MSSSINANTTIWGHLWKSRQVVPTSEFANFPLTFDVEVFLIFSSTLAFPFWVFVFSVRLWSCTDDEEDDDNDDNLELLSSPLTMGDFSSVLMSGASGSFCETSELPFRCWDLCVNRVQTLHFNILNSQIVWNTNEPASRYGNLKCCSSINYHKFHHHYHEVILNDVKA